MAWALDCLAGRVKGRSARISVDKAFQGPKSRCGESL